MELLEKEQEKISKNLYKIKFFFLIKKKINPKNRVEKNFYKFFMARNNFFFFFEN